MKTLILTVATIALTAVLCCETSVFAAPTQPTNPNPPTPPATNPNPGIAPKTGQPKQARGVSYARNFRDWTTYRWLPQYGCYGYYLGSDRVWYYWCESKSRFLPLSYIRIFPPTIVGTAPVPQVAGTPAPLPQDSTTPPGTGSARPTRNNGSPAPAGGNNTPAPSDPLPIPE